MYKYYNFRWYLLLFKLRKALYNSIKDVKYTCMRSSFKYIFEYAILFLKNFRIIIKCYLYISGHLKKRHTRYHETFQKCKAPLRDVQKTGAISLALLLLELWPFEQ